MMPSFILHDLGGCMQVVISYERHIHFFLYEMHRCLKVSSFSFLIKFEHN